MADDNKSWREQADEAGYVYMPKSDLDTLKKDANFGRDVRAKLPEDYRDKPMDFITEATTSMSRLEEMQTSGNKAVDELNQQITTLKSQNTKLKNENETISSQVGGLQKENHTLNMWGLIGRTQQLHNVFVDDTFISDAAVEQFDVSRFNTQTAEGQKSILEAIQKEIVAPAVERQTAVVNRVAGGGARRDSGNNQQNGARDSGGNRDQQMPTLKMWGNV